MVQTMTARAAFQAWAPFAATVCITLLVRMTMWSSSYYYVMLSSCAILSLVLGMYALWRVGIKPWSVALVVVGLIVGQWWFFEMALMFAFWKWRGFAP